MQQHTSPYDGFVPDKPEPSEPQPEPSEPQPIPDPVPEPGDSNMGKGLLRSRTFWVNMLTAAVSIGTYITNSEVLANNPEVVAIGGTVIGVLNVLLRLVTKEPINGVK